MKHDEDGPDGMPNDFIGREDQREYLCQHFESPEFKRLLLANKQNRLKKTMHHHTGSSPIIYAMEELRVQGEPLPIINGFEKAYVRPGDEVPTKYYADMLDAVKTRKENYKKDHPEATEEEIMESIQSQQIDVLNEVLKPRKGGAIRGMGRGGEPDMDHSLSTGSTSRNHARRIDEQQLKDIEERAEQRVREAKERAREGIREVEERAQQKIQEVQHTCYATSNCGPMPTPRYKNFPPSQVPPHNNNDDNNSFNVDDILL